MKIIHSLALVMTVSAISIAAPPLRAATESDKKINDQIFRAMLNDRSLAQGTDKLTATTQNGVVTLSGDVRSQEDKEQLHKAIAGTPGVQRVNDSRVVLKPVPASRFGTDHTEVRMEPRQGRPAPEPRINTGP